jgi:hypothetical protein
MLLDSENYLARYTNNLGISRKRNSTKTIPALQNIRILYCYGDLDSILMFCNTIYPNIVYNDKFYNIFITWNGFEFANKYADEVWSFNDEKITDMFYKSTNGIQNTSDGVFSLTRSLNENFINVEGPQKYEKYFTTNLQDLFVKEFKTLNIKTLELQSQSIINDNILKRISEDKKKVCIIPFKYAYHWDTNKKICIEQNQEVHEEVAKILAGIDYKVLVIQNSFTLDLSKNIQNDNVVIVRESNFEKILVMIKLCGMYLDIFANSFALGGIAKVPTVSVFDKPSWMAFKKYEDVELFLQKGFYNFVPSFNYFSKTEYNTNKLFVRKIANTVKLFYNKNVGSPTYSKEISFDTENFCHSKLNYFRTKKVFFLRSPSDA